MDTIITLAALVTPLIALAMLGVAATRFGADTRDPMTDDHGALIVMQQLYAWIALDNVAERHRGAATRRHGTLIRHGAARTPDRFPSRAARTIARAKVRALAAMTRGTATSGTRLDPRAACRVADQA